MSDVELWDLVTPTKALRHLIQGRVLLKEDYTSGVTVKVGTEYASGGGVAGTMMFKGKSTACKLVEPESAVGAADGHEEDVTIVDPSSGEPLHITLTGAATNDYHTSRGAYLALRDSALPALLKSTGLKFVQQDLELAGDVQSHKLPAVLVQLVDVQKDHPGSVQFRFQLGWQCKFYRQRDEGEDISDEFYSDFQTLINQIEEDHRIGGTVEQAHVIRAQRLPNVANNPFDIGQFQVWAQVDRTYTKAL